MPSNPPPRLSSPYLSLGLTLSVGMVVFTLIGQAIDKKRGGGSGFTLAGMFLGLIYGGYEIWKAVRQINKDNPEKPKSS